MSARTNFFDGMQVSSFDMTYSQLALTGQIKNHASDFYTAGVVNGLSVYTDTSTFQHVTVGSGVAYDPTGERIYVPLNVTRVGYNNGPINAAAGNYIVAVRHLATNDGQIGVDPDGISHARHIYDSYQLATIKTGSDSLQTNDVRLYGVNVTAPGSSLIFDSAYRDLMTYRVSHVGTSNFTVTNVKDLGAKGDDIQDDTDIISAAMGRGGILYLPPGTYKVTNSVFNNTSACSRFMIMGAGRATTLKFYHPTSNPFGLTFSDQTDVVIKDMNIDGENMVFDQAARGAISFSGTSFGVVRGLIDNVHILNWQGTGILLSGCDNVTVRDCYIYRSYEHSMYLAGSFDKGNNVIVNNTITESGYNSGTSHFGLKISNFQRTVIAGNHFIRPQSHGATFEADNQQTSLIDNRFYLTTANRAISVASGAKCGDIAHNEIEVTVPLTTAIYADSAYPSRIINNEIRLVSNSNGMELVGISNWSVSFNRISGGGAATGISVGTTSQNNLISHNIIDNFISGIAVILGASTTNNRVMHNLFSNVSTEVSDSGTTNYIETPRYLKGTKTWDPGSAGGSTAVSTTTTVTGAAMGDVVTNSFSLDLQSMIMSSYVSSSNTVTTILFNPTGAPIDLGSGTLKLFVWK